MAYQQTNGWILILIFHIFVKAGKIELQLPKIGRLEIPALQFNGDHAFQNTMEKDKIREILLVIHNKTFLHIHETKIRT